MPFLLSVGESVLKNLVIGLVKNYNFEQIRPFVASLRATGYADDVCLLYSDIDHESVQALRQYNVRLVPFQMGRINLLFKRVHYCRLLSKIFNSPLNRLYSMSQVYARAIRWWASRQKDPVAAKCRLAAKTFNVYCVRYPLYYLYLAERRGEYQNVMMADVRDVLFQRDPFDFEWPAELNLFLEDSRQPMKDCPFNSNWLRTGFGDDVLQAFGDKVASCSGITIGSYAAVMQYLELMIDHMINLNSHPAGIDQGVHNYLLYEGKLNGAHVFPNGAGPVLTMGKTVDLPTPLNDEGRVLNTDGTVVNVLHQYDRHIEQGWFQLDEQGERLFPQAASTSPR